MKNRIVFFGTPRFAAEVLTYLLSHSTSIVAIVTQPDRPKGRSLEVSPSFVKETATKLAPQIPIFQPEKASDPLFLQALENLQADLYVVVAFGQILSQKLLDIPRLGCINVHASLLPKYRGAAPIQRALMAAESKTGIAIQKMVKQLDAGDVIQTAECPIGPNTTFAQLEETLCDLAKPLLLSVLQMYEKGVPNAIAQDHSLATYAPKIEPQEGQIDWNQDAVVLHNQIRAFSPRPGAWCWVEINGEKRRLKILQTHVSSEKGEPGHLSSRGLVFCKSGALELLEVQPEGKRPMKISEWLCGFKNFPRLF